MHVIVGVSEWRTTKRGFYYVKFIALVIAMNETMPKVEEKEEDTTATTTIKTMRQYQNANVIHHLCVLYYVCIAHVLYTTLCTFDAYVARSGRSPKTIEQWQLFATDSSLIHSEQC